MDEGRTLKIPPHGTNSSLASHLLLASLSGSKVFFKKLNDCIRLEVCKLFYEGPDINILGFGGHTASVVTSQLCHYSVKGATDSL